MNPTAKLNAIGQSLWLDDITRDMLDSGALKAMIDTLSVTGLTSNPTIFDHALGHSTKYDDSIRELVARGFTKEALFFELALDDLTRAADLFRPIHDRTAGVDGFVSLEVSPLLAYDTRATIAEAKRLHDRANRPNLYVKIPGTKEGLPAIEESIFAGVAINVTLLFSVEDYVASAEAYIRGLERRVEAGLAPDVRSVASIFISRWDRAIADKVPEPMRNTLGVAIGRKAFAAYRRIMASDRWQRLMNLGARPQRLLFASTGVKDPKAKDTLYVQALAAPNTVNTIPEATLRAFADHGAVEALIAADGGDAEKVLADHTKAGINLAAVAAQLQSDGAKSFVSSWNELLGTIAKKSQALS